MSCNYVRPHIWHICVLSGRQSDTERPLLIIWIPSLAKMLYFFLFLVSPAALLFVVLNAVHGLAFMLCQACVFMHMISVFSHLVLIHILFRIFLWIKEFIFFFILDIGAPDMVLQRRLCAFIISCWSICHIFSEYISHFMNRLVRCSIPISIFYRSVNSVFWHFFASFVDCTRPKFCYPEYYLVPLFNPFGLDSLVLVPSGNVLTK